MGAPNIYRVDFLRKWDALTEIMPGKWAAARPERWPGLKFWRRLQFAALVFIGRADVLVWAQDEVDWSEPTGGDGTEVE